MTWMTFGNEPWSSFKNGFWNSLRYVLIAGMFVLLLAMVILLNEIMEFHNGIVQQVGEPYARRVVLMLDEMDRQPLAYPEEPGLPVAEVAVELDDVRRNLAELGRFTEIRSANGEAPDQAGQPGEDGADGIDLFKERNEELQKRLDTLRRTLYDASPFVAVAAALREFKGSVRELGDAVPAGDATPPPATGIVAAPVALEGQIKGLIEELDTLTRGVRALPHAAALSTELANLRGQVEQLQDYQFAATEPQEAPGGDGAAAAKAADPPKNDVPAPADDGADPKRGESVSGDDGADKNGDSVPGDEMVEDSITEIDKSIGTIESTLRAAFPDFGLFATVSAEVQTMRDQAGRFGSVVAADYPTATDQPLSREEAEDRFDQTRNDLDESIAQIEQQLQGRTRVTTLANVIRENSDLSDTGAAAIARTILHDFDSLSRFLPVLMPLQWAFPADWALARFGVAPKRLATLSTDSIQAIYIFMIGAIGSLLYITRYHLKLALEGKWLGSAPTRPLPWLLFRPIFGVVVAFAVYLFVTAGQFAFGSGSLDGVGTDLNIPILSVVALFAGLLSWQALEAIESRGRRWFASQTREPMWATGLDHALRTSGHTYVECGYQVGRSAEQVERWLMFRDKVTEEMQDRIRTWLDKPADELFGRVEPKDKLDARAMWAVGLRGALANRDTQLDAEGLVELLREEKRPDNVERVRKWIDLKLQVTPPMQWQLVERLGVPHGKLFATEVEGREIWALHLRSWIERSGMKTQELADRMGLEATTIHAWKELEKPVPTDAQDRLLNMLKGEFTDLFKPGPMVGEPEGEGDREQAWLLHANGLGKAISDKYGKRDLEAFGAEIDVDVDRVQAWIDRRKPVAIDTRAMIRRVLRDVPDLFSPPKLGG